MKRTFTRPELELGDKVKDTISGYTGIAICIGDWISGCRRVTVQARELKDGKPVDAMTFDVEQLEVIEDKSQPVSSPSGGPCPEPTRNEQ